MKKTLIAFALLLSASVYGQQRREINLKTWDFSRDNATWSQVQIPHDWAIAGPFDKKWDLQTVRIEQNGEKQATEKSGRSGALPWIGEGWYRTTVDVPAGYDHAELVFDGAMAEPRVTVNGQEAGYWAYGYNAFRVDVTPFLTGSPSSVSPSSSASPSSSGSPSSASPSSDGPVSRGSATARRLSIGVHLQNVEESSRWYPGAGLYRPVKLVLTQKTYIDDWSIFVRTMSINNNEAVVEAEARVVNPVKGAAQVFLKGPDGSTASSGDTRIEPDGKIYAKFRVKNPQLWSPETPNLYNVAIEVYQGHHEVLDRKTVKTGIRTVRVSREGGFQLNGQTRKLKGVCLHHDLGPLGAAINKSALIRQIRTMKEMGCDAIRTAHNMPSTWQMEVCDSMGMMVMGESFDMWLYKKCKNGYARFFREWAEKDITNLVLNHRNHPSIVMWSIGNEIPEQWSEEGRQISIQLQGLCHSLDPTRPVTQGCDKPDKALKSGFIQAMDVPGLNYRLHRYADSYKQLPQGFLLGSETASTVSSRGAYYFPVKPTDKGVHPDGQCSSYDVEWCSWSNLPDDDWVWQDDYSWVIGEFVWTGYDYLGEPTPYDEYWPSRSSYFGICDLAGLPKDRYWLYRSKWNQQEHTVHLLPHWTWPDRKGQVTPVYCYTDGVEAELFINGKSQGRIRKNKSERLDRYRLRWNDVKYEPGELRVVAYDANGNKIGEDVRRTAGKAVALTAIPEPAPGSPASGSPISALSAPGSPVPESPVSAPGSPVSPISFTATPSQPNSQPSYHADGESLIFVRVSATDKRGTEVPTANNNLTFSVSGAATFEAACNGDATSLQSFKQPEMQLFNGELVVILRPTTTAGRITLTIRDKQGRLKPTTLTLHTI